MMNPTTRASTIAVLLALLAACSSGAGVGATKDAGQASKSYDFPSGIFTDAGELAASNNPLQDTNMQGGLIRVFWKDIEPVEGQYSWTLLDQMVDTVECNSVCYSGSSGGTCKNDLTSVGRGSGCTAKSFSLAVLAGQFSPSWLYTDGIGSLSNGGDAGPPTKIPKLWDPALPPKLASLATALAARYGTDPHLKLVYVPQMSVNGVEGAFPGYSDIALTDAGFTVDGWVNGVEQTAQAFSAAFSTKSTAIELHYLLNSSCAGLRIMSDIATNGGAFQGRSDKAIAQVGVASWWYGGAADPNSSGLSEYQGDLLFGTSFADSRDAIGTPEPGDTNDAAGRTCAGKPMQQGGFHGFGAAGGRVYAQVIYNSKTTKGTCAGDATNPCSEFPFGFGPIFPEALALPIRSIEIWQEDVGATWASSYATFNAATVK